MTAAPALKRASGRSGHPGPVPSRHWTLATGISVWFGRGVMPPNTQVPVSCVGQTHEAVGTEHAVEVDTDSARAIDPLAVLVRVALRTGEVVQDLDHLVRHHARADRRRVHPVK